MAYYLEVDGTVEYVSFANILITGDYFITAKFIPQQANPNADGIFLGRESNTWLGVYGGGLRLSTPEGFQPIIPLPTSNIEYTVNVNRVGTLTTLECVGVGSVTFTTSADLEFNLIGRYRLESTFAFVGKIGEINLNNQAIYNPTLSAEAGGTLLIDEVGGNHGTLSGFSSSNPFVYYYDFLNPSEEDTTNDNCLVLPENRPNGEQLDLVAGANNSREFDLRIVWSQSHIDLILGVASSAQHHLVFRFGGDKVRLGVQWGLYEFTLNNNFNNYTDLVTLEFKLTANTLTAKQDGVALAETFGVGTKGFKLPVEAFRSSREINLHSLSFISHDFPEDSRFYDGNRSPATAPVVPELINGQNGTMVGFPEPSGYVKNTSNAIVGYRFRPAFARNLTPIVKASDFSIQLNFSMASINSLDYLFSMWASRGLFLQNSTPKIALYLVPFTVVNYALPAPLIAGDDLEVHIDVVDVGGGNVDVTLSIAINGGGAYLAWYADYPCIGFSRQ